MRDDAHSPTQIIPADYRYLMSFSNHGTYKKVSIPRVNVDELLKFKERIILRGRNFCPVHDSVFRCDCCGAHYKHGDAFEHVLTGDVVTFGHVCSDKYQLMADREGWKRIRAIIIEEAMKVQRRKKFRIQRFGEMKNVLSSNDGLATALKFDNSIIKNIREQLISKGYITQSQISLVHKIIKDNANKEAEITPNDGRAEIIGTIVSVKTIENQFGYSTKCLVQCGGFRVYGTLPSGVKDADRGDSVTFTATLNNSKKGFAFYKRPTKARFS